MKYTKEFTEHVRSVARIESVVYSYTELSGVGRFRFGCCPFEKNGKETFIVDTQKQTYLCCCCGRKGNIIDFLVDMQNISPDEAVDVLVNLYHIEQENVNCEMTDEATKARMKETADRVAVLYSEFLYMPVGREALAYLKGRGLTDKTIKKFRLGYAPLYYDLQESTGLSEEALREIGLLKDGEYGAYNFYRNRVIFPIFNENSEIVSFSGRVLDDSKPKYINTPNTAICTRKECLYGYNFARWNDSSYYIICEGQMDVVTLHQAGFVQAVAAMGSAFTPAQARLFYRDKKSVFVSQDSDAAGQGACCETLKLLYTYGVPTRIVNLLPHKDPDEFIKAEGENAYENRLKESQDSFDFLMSYVRKKDGENSEAVVKEMEQLYLRRFNNEGICE